MLLFSYNRANNGVLIRGRLELDLDSASERFCVIDRESLSVIYANNSDKLVLHLDEKYTITENLTVVMFDDGGQFNAVVADGVKLSTFNVNSL